MGYNTNYTLTPDVPAVRAFLKDGDAYLGDDHLNGNEGLKWYEHERDIARAMLATGTTIVQVHGEGEEQGDVWDKEFEVIDGEVRVSVYKFELIRPERPDECRTWRAL